MENERMKKGKQLGVVKTLGEYRGNYDLYNIEGLTLGKLKLISRLLENEVEMNQIARDIYLAINRHPLDENQTVNK